MLMGCRCAMAKGESSCQRAKLVGEDLLGIKAEVTAT